MIDAHQHFWQIGRNDCEWPTEDLAAIYRSFDPHDLKPLLDTHGITGTVLVQSQPSDLDTDFLLQLAEETDFIKGVVGWADLAAANACDRIRGLAGTGWLKGLRPMLQGLEDDEWILRPDLAPALGTMVDEELAFDALIYTRHLPAIRTLAARYPDLRIVIDHGAKPPIRSGDLGPWEREMSLTARLPNICCKLSGLPAEAAPGGQEEDIRHCIRTLFALFGEDRLIWGSDWPVVRLASDYGAWFGLCRGETGPSEAIYRTNAEQFYRLET